MSKSNQQLLFNISHLVTMDSQSSELKDAAIYIEDHRINWIGRTSEIPREYLENAEKIDMRGYVVLPGFINTHHHMFQSLTRAVPQAQDAELFGWLKTLYPIWGKITPEMINVSALTAMAELMLSGCTTTSDHLYLFPNGSSLEDEISAAQFIGIRFHAARGSMSVGESLGGLPPDALVEDEHFILKDTQRLIERWHDSSKYSMLHIVVAPCSPFSVSENLMRESALLARHYGVRLHTHLAENMNDVLYSKEKFNQTPAQYAESLGWVGDDVWHAHCVHLDDSGIQLFGRSKTGVCHCPSSNMRLASGIAPVRQMLNAGVPVGLGVDGSASNDSGNLIQEVRQVMLLQRVANNDPQAMNARQALRMATVGGAQVLGRNDIGSLQVGMAADMIGFKQEQLSFAGCIDPVAAIVFSPPSKVDFSMIHGKVRVKNGEILNLDLQKHIAHHIELSQQLMKRN